MNATPTPLIVLPLNQAARRFRVQMQWLRDEARAGRLPALFAGDRLLFNPDALARALAERAAQPPAPAEGGSRE